MRPLASAVVDGKTEPPDAKQLAQHVSRCPVIDITNVAEFVARSEEKDGREWQWSEFPSLSPPFNEFWLEMRLTREMVSLYRDAGYSDSTTATNRRVASFWSWFSIEEIESLETHQRNHAREAANKFPAGYWFGAIYRFLEDKTGTAAMVRELSGIIVLDRNGSVIAKTGKTGGASTPELLAIALMHCKNVTLVDRVVPPRLAKALTKRGRPAALLKWKILNIDPMKRTLRTEGNADAVGLKRALHICRGHFKDYRQSGLFGKVKGVFWWDASMRGDAASGGISKDYRVNAPR